MICLVVFYIPVFVASNRALAQRITNKYLRWAVCVGIVVVARIMLSVLMLAFTGV